MSYRIKELFEGRQLTGCDSADLIVRDISEQTKSFTICASSDRPDRSKDVVIQEGLSWTSWLKNPVVPWGHQYQNIPVAKGSGSPWIEKEGDISKTFVRMTMGSHDEATKIFNAIREGLIRSASIGFISRQSEKIEISSDDEDEHPFQNPRKYVRADILEVSLVTLPMNSDATMSLKAMVNNGQLPPFVIESYDSLSPEAEFELDSIAREHRLDAALESLNGDLEDDLDDDDLGDVSRAELEALVKLAIRQVLGRLD